MSSFGTFPEKGTRGYHIKMLKKLKAWLDKNPSNNPVVDDESAAIEWALEELGAQ